LDRTAIILAGGFSSRFGSDKGILKIADKSLILHVADSVSSIVDEIIIVTNSKKKIKKYTKEVFDLKANFFLDLYKGIGPLAGALTGLKNAKGEYSLIVPFDTPFLSKKILSLLFNLCRDKSAVIPRWPNDHIEPLHAVYRTIETLNAATDAISKQETQLRAMIQRLNNVFYISTEIIKKFDPKLRTFLNINSPTDLARAKEYSKQRLKK
jgi:molybdopterin-guanine dinucleotide biosynthesis protein A